MSIFRPSQLADSLFKPRVNRASLFKPQTHRGLFSGASSGPRNSIFAGNLTATSSLFPSALPAGQDMWFKGENDAGWSLEKLIPRD